MSLDMQEDFGGTSSKHGETSPTQWKQALARNTVLTPQNMLDSPYT